MSFSPWTCNFLLGIVLPSIFCLYPLGCIRTRQLSDFCREYRGWHPKYVGIIVNHQKKKQKWEQNLRYGSFLPTDTLEKESDESNHSGFNFFWAAFWSCQKTDNFWSWRVRKWKNFHMQLPDSLLLDMAQCLGLQWQPGKQCSTLRFAWGFDRCPFASLERKKSI